MRKSLSNLFYCSCFTNFIKRKWLIDFLSKQTNISLCFLLSQAYKLASENRNAWNWPFCSFELNYHIIFLFYPNNRLGVSPTTIVIGTSVHKQQPTKEWSWIPSPISILLLSPLLCGFSFISTRTNNQTHLHYSKSHNYLT